MTTYPIIEGRIPYKGYSTWYRIVGEREDDGKLPLLCLHGGPGATHDYLESLDALAATGRRVIYYDQLGCGRSSIPESKPALWTIPLYLEEVDAVRAALGLERVHILGQSWGGMLLMEYLLTQPSGVASGTIASSPASMIQWVTEANRLRADLPPDVEATLLKHEADGTTTHPDYTAAVQVFYDRHLCRVPYPEYMQRSMDFLAAGGEVYNTMNGPSEFHVIGTIKDWDIIDRLPEINAKVLITSGQYDEATPLIAETVQKGIRGSHWMMLGNSSHSAHIEEKELYNALIAGWLALNE
ncbi:MAG: proline iminopeptidase-family hydrolase [Chloroflexota bacterium]|nr:proline iminopeptidase-family hydrolase [Chloroflexota bacterium]